MGCSEVLYVVQNHPREVLAAAEVPHVRRDTNICDERIQGGITVYLDTAEDEESSSLEEFYGFGMELWGQRGKWKCIPGYEAERLLGRCTNFSFK